MLLPTVFLPRLYNPGHLLSGHLINCPVKYMCVCITYSRGSPLEQVDEEKGRTG